MTGNFRILAKALIKVFVLLFISGVFVIEDNCMPNVGHTTESNNLVSSWSGKLAQHNIKAVKTSNRFIRIVH